MSITDKMIHYITINFVSYLPNIFQKIMKFRDTFYNTRKKAFTLTNV